MTVAASILLAAIVGGVVFVLLDSWQRRADAPPAPEPHQPTWVPEARTEPLWRPPPSPRWDDRDDDPPPPGLWSGWSR